MKKYILILITLVVSTLQQQANLMPDKILITGGVFLNIERRPGENLCQYIRIDSLAHDGFGLMFVSNYMRNLDFIVFADSRNNPEFYRNNLNGGHYLFYFDTASREIFVFNQNDISFWKFKNHLHDTVNVKGICDKKLGKLAVKQDKYITETKNYVASMARSGDLKNKLLEPTNNNFKLQFDVFSFELGRDSCLQTVFTKNFLSNDANLEIAKRVYTYVFYPLIEERIMGNDNVRKTTMDKSGFIDSTIAGTLKLKNFSESVKTNGLTLDTTAKKNFWIYAGLLLNDGQVTSEIFDKNDLSAAIKKEKNVLELKKNVVLREKFPVYNTGSKAYIFGNVTGFASKGFIVETGEIKKIPSVENEKANSIWINLAKISPVTPTKQNKDFKHMKVFLSE